MIVCMQSLAAVVLAATAAQAQLPAPSPLPSQTMEFFEKRVRPILAENCFSCHGAEKQKAGLRLDSPAALLKGSETGPVVIPGNPADSVLIRAIRQEGDVKMPPKGKLPAEAIDALTTWIKLGAPWPPTLGKAQVKSETDPISEARKNYWAFRPVRKPSVPPVRNERWAQTEIDRFILAKLEEKGLKPAKPADRRTLIRRATFDLLGLPPTPHEVAAFEADRSPSAFARVIDRLLASPHYG
jgi:mono/diheme cytochrome c family protein